MSGPGGGAVSAELAELAAAYGVATSYHDARARPHDVGAGAVRAALAAMAVPADDPQDVSAALEEARLRPWRARVPPATVALAGRAGSFELTLRLPAAGASDARLTLEDGTSVRPPPPGPVVERRAIDGLELVSRRLALPVDLPLGYHRLSVRAGGDGPPAEGTVVVAPPRCPQPDGLGPTWGWMLQLYALRSADSWAMGDLADLAHLAAWSGAELGAGFVLCNPLHAATPVPPLEPSPYYPSSRRFASPLYLRVEDLPELADAVPAVRARVGRLATEARAGNRAHRIDRDAVWRAKSAALELLRAVPARRERVEAFAAFREEGGRPLEAFATFCALAERHGSPWQDWPAALRHPRARAVAEARATLADRVGYHAWLQFCCHTQLADAQRAATGAGMPLGLLHDVAVGVDPGGADSWALQDDLAAGVTVGAPPDPFNQQGQDWRLPPLRPDRLAATGYRPFRDIIAAALRHGGGVRIDHVMGLFRQWWVPQGRAPTDGTYVRYPSRDLLGVLALEAERAGALVVGEDLGTVEDAVRDALAEAGVFGSRLVYFERTGDGQRPRPPTDYPERVLASVTTHDLPTVAGWWADEDVRVQADLGLLGAGTTAGEEYARKERERAEMLDLLRAEGLVGDDPSADELVEALHGLLARVRSLLVAATPADAVGDLRQPNLPGTTEAYPNWRLPLAEPTPEGPRPLLLDDLYDHPRVRRLAEVMNEGRRLAAARDGTDRR